MIHEQNVPDELVSELQDIYWDPSNDQKEIAVKQAIVKHIAPMINQQSDDMTLVKKSDLDFLIARVKEDKVFREDAEREIGWAAALLVKIDRSIKNPMSLATKAAKGELTAEAFGIDMDRLHAMGMKFAPATMAQLSKEDSKQVKK